MASDRVARGLSVMLTCAGVGGCAATDGMTRDTWNVELCAQAIGRVTSALAGPGAVDCGVVYRSMGEHFSRGTEACAASVVARELPFRFGEAIFGIDSGECDAIVRAADGPIFWLHYEYDLTLGGRHGQRTVNVSACSRVMVDPNPPKGGSFIQPNGCAYDDDAEQRVLALHNGPGTPASQH
jgi:hypothetical protein